MLINLHTHLEGRVRPSTAAELASELAIIPPGATSWEDALELSEPSDLSTYLAKVAASYPFFSSCDRIARLAWEVVEDAAADGTDYLELRFGPATHSMASPPLTLEGVVEAVCDGIAEGTRRTGMPAGAIVCALRHHDAETNNAVAAAAAKFAGSGVVGFDLAGDEQRYPSLEPYVDAFRIARTAGLGLTCHAAEAADGGAAQEAVHLFGVSRIGHGVHLAQHSDLLDWCREEGVVIECCPTSNWFTGGVDDLSSHPIRAFHQAGVAVVLGDDNPRQTRSSLSNEYRLLSGLLDFGPADLATLERASVRSAFVDESVRAALTARLPQL